MADRPGSGKADALVAAAQKARLEREQGYRAQALKMYPHVCGRCGRAFEGQALRELTVHHRNHDHDFNPPDGSNWELLCVYCHDAEHQRWITDLSTDGPKAADAATHNPFAALADLLKPK
jgi:5-methylcytosine-specific restriction endonuclease McrA